MSSSNPVDGGQFSTREVVIAPYDPQWKNEFEKICAMIQSYIGEYLESIEHVGSTSVEGLGAKPIIDVDAVLRDRNDLPMVIERLAAYGYVHQGDLGLPGREAFFRPRDYDAQEQSVMNYHFYVCAVAAVDNVFFGELVGGRNYDCADFVKGNHTYPSFGPLHEHKKYYVAFFNSVA